MLLGIRGSKLELRICKKNEQHFAEGKASTLEEDLCPYHSSAPMVTPVTYGFISLKDAAKGEAESLRLRCKLI